MNMSEQDPGSAASRPNTLLPETGDYPLTPHEPATPVLKEGKTWGLGDDELFSLGKYEKYCEPAPSRTDGLTSWGQYHADMDAWMRVDLLTYPHRYKVARRFSDFAEELSRPGAAPTADQLLRLASLRTATLFAAMSRRKDRDVFAEAFGQPQVVDIAEDGSPIYDAQSARDKADPLLRHFLLHPESRAAIASRTAPVALLELAVEVCDPRWNDVSVVPLCRQRTVADRRELRNDIGVLWEEMRKSTRHEDPHSSFHYKKDPRTLFAIACSVTDRLGLDNVTDTTGRPQRASTNMKSNMVREVLAQRIIALKPPGKEGTLASLASLEMVNRAGAFVRSERWDRRRKAAAGAGAVIRASGIEVAGDVYRAGKVVGLVTLQHARGSFTAAQQRFNRKPGSDEFHFDPNNDQNHPDDDQQKPQE
jgi:hypothetical protein